MSASEPTRPHVWFKGDFARWSDAARHCTGYDAPSILEKVLIATRKVVAGEAACERDSVTFDEPQYSPSLLACLLWVASRSNNRLEVLDFGGSLGSSYWQHRGLLDHLDALRWSIVEQPHFVAAGRAEIESDCLRFFETVDDCLASESPGTVLLSGVLQCLEAPYEVLASIFARRLPYVILDRTQCFVADLPDRITIETVDPAVYEGSYPSWFLNLPKLRTFVAAAGYEIVAEFDSWEAWDVDGDPARNKCLLLAAKR